MLSLPIESIVPLPVLLPSSRSVVRSRPPPRPPAEGPLGLSSRSEVFAYSHKKEGLQQAFAREVAAARLPHVTLLRHTHITHLLRSGVPVHVVSERAGHANPTVTLNIYAHLLPGQQEAAAVIIDAALRSAIQD
jgi:integrase